MPNWDDQFDFDDLDDNKNKAKTGAKANDKKATNYDDQFFDEQDSGKKKEVKSMLPIIKPRNSAKSKINKQQSTTKVNPYANKSFGSKQALNDDDENYFEEQIVDEVSKEQPKTTSIKQIKSKIITEEKKAILNKNSREVKEQYNDQFMEEQVEQSLHQPIKQKQKSKPSQSIQPNPSHTKLQKKEQPNTHHLQSSKSNQKPNKPKQVQAELNQYEEEFQEESYADDGFQEEVQSPPKHINKNNPLASNPKSKPDLKIVQTQKQSQQSKKYVPIKTNNLIPSQNKKQKQIQGRSPSTVPPKPPATEKKNGKQVIASNKNFHKIQSQSVSKPLKRSSSRKSIRSNGQKSIKGSRISQKNQSQYFPNKHLDMVAKSFPHDEDKLNLLSQIQINKVNEKMRAMIRKFNQELNDLINKNMLLLKNKSLQKHLTIEERIKQLQIQKKSGQTAIDVMQKDFDKLQGRQGELKEEEYQLILQRQIQQKKTHIKETTKQITILKRQVDNKGKKLSAKQTEQQNAQNIHHLKTNLIQTRKQQEKGDQKIQKLTSTYEELETKISDIDYKLEELVSQAKEKGISIENNDQMQKKYEDLKGKLENIKNFNKKAEGLNGTKIQILNHQNEQVRITIRNISSQISNLYGSIDHSQGQAIKLIQKAKQKPGINPLFAQSLDNLLKQLQESRANNDYLDARSEIKSRRSDSTKNRPQKNPIQQIVQKQMPLRVTQSQNRLVQDVDPSVVKPKFLKKKPGQSVRLDIQNKSQHNQRVWNNEQEAKNKVLINDQNKRAVQENSTREVTKEKVQAIEQQKKDKIKPFMLKKNKPADLKTQENHQSNMQPISRTVTDEKVTLPSPLNQPFNNQLSKKEESSNINIAPRMMKFGRKKNNEDGTSQNNILLSDNKLEHQSTAQNKVSPNIDNKNSGITLEIKDVPKKQQEQDKPIFVPKRFNLRNKVEKKDESYTPSVQNDNSFSSSAQVNTVISTKPELSTKQIQQDYKPKLNLQTQQFDANIQNHYKNEQFNPIEEPEIKPKFNLRLRDQMNKKNQQIQKQPSLFNPLNNNSTQNAKNSSVDKKDQFINKIQPKPSQNQFIISKQDSLKSENKQNAFKNLQNPYAPKKESQHIVQNRQVQVKKNDVSPYEGQKLNSEIMSNNPYAAKFQMGSKETSLNQGNKKERGPLKKNKISTNLPKQSFNIYAQADDVTNELKQIGAVKTASQNIYESASNKPPGLKSRNQELNLNQMLGIKKDVKKNEFDDLLGDIGGANAKSKKKNNDFFDDLQF